MPVEIVLPGKLLSCALSLGDRRGCCVLSAPCVFYSYGSNIIKLLFPILLYMVSKVSHLVCTLSLPDLIACSVTVRVINHYNTVVTFRFIMLPGSASIQWKLNNRL